MISQQQQTPSEVISSSAFDPIALMNSLKTEPTLANNNNHNNSSNEENIPIAKLENNDEDFEEELNKNIISSSIPAHDTHEISFSAQSAVASVAASSQGNSLLHNINNNFSTNAITSTGAFDLSRYMNSGVSSIPNFLS